MAEDLKARNVPDHVPTIMGHKHLFLNFNDSKMILEIVDH